MLVAPDLRVASLYRVNWWGREVLEHFYVYFGFRLFCLFSIFLLTVFLFLHLSPSLPGVIVYVNAFTKLQRPVSWRAHGQAVAEPRNILYKNTSLGEVHFLWPFSVEATQPPWQDSILCGRDR